VRQLGERQAGPGHVADRGPGQPELVARDGHACWVDEHVHVVGLPQPEVGELGVVGLRVEQSITDRAGASHVADGQQRHRGQRVVVDETDVAETGVVLIALDQPVALGVVGVGGPLQERDGRPERGALLAGRGAVHPRGLGRAGAQPEQGYTHSESGTRAQQASSGEGGSDLV
jgi:hypothetical protein